jgi:UDP-N-acetylmuramoylalanine-D-glutamate ligase
MAKLALATLVAAALSTLAVVGLTSSGVDAATACKTKKFETTLVAEACKTDQKKAKDEMKKWMKVAKKQKADLACATCHSKVGGAYPLKPDALKLFKELGGK